MFSYQQQKQIDASCDWTSNRVSDECATALTDAFRGVGYYYMSALYDQTHSHIQAETPRITRRHRPRITHSHSLYALYRCSYNIYDTCPHDLEAVAIADLTEDQLAEVGLFAPIMSDALRDLGFVCVLESVSSDYLNTASVQQALHVTQANVSDW